MWEGWSKALPSAANAQAPQLSPGLGSSGNLSVPSRAQRAQRSSDAARLAASKKAALAASSEIRPYRCRCALNPSLNPHLHASSAWMSLRHQRVRCAIPDMPGCVHTQGQAARLGWAVQLLAQLAVLGRSMAQPAAGGPREAHTPACTAQQGAYWVTLHASCIRCSPGRACGQSGCACAVRPQAPIILSTLTPNACRVDGLRGAAAVAVGEKHSLALQRWQRGPLLDVAWAGLDLPPAPEAEQGCEQVSCLCAVPNGNRSSAQGVGTGGVPT